MSSDAMELEPPLWFIDGPRVSLMEPSIGPAIDTRLIFGQLAQSQTVNVAQITALLGQEFVRGQRIHKHPMDLSE